MADKSPSHAERVARILNGLAEHIETVPDQELLDDIRREGEDPQQIATQVKSLLLGAVKAHRQRELNAARAGYAQEVSAIKSREIHLPADPQIKRALFAAVLNQRPQLQAALTLQNRDFSTLTDDDIDAHLRKLEMLGVLKDIKLPDDKR
jgi:hypothetical protein